MEILVILMLATVFFAIAMFIVSFIMVKKHHTDKVYEKGSDNLYLDDDDDDDDNVVNSVNNVIDDERQVDVSSKNTIENDSIKEETKDDLIIQEEILDKVEENKEIVEELVDDIKEAPIDVKKEIDENTTIDIIVPITENKENTDVVKEVETDMQEVVNVLINKKNYMFLANGNKVSKGEHIKLVLNKKIYFGLITKGNYMRDIRPLKNKPYKLIIIKNNKPKKEEIEVLDTSDLEFIPKRKSQS